MVQADAETVPHTSRLNHVLKFCGFLKATGAFQCTRVTPYTVNNYSYTGAHGNHQTDFTEWNCGVFPK